MDTVDLTAPDLWDRLEAVYDKQDGVAPRIIKIEMARDEDSELRSSYQRWLCRADERSAYTFN